ncbi:threonine kinase [Natronincola peptidivorans]|uniref:Threonine kinase n=1 Tax=Natronincola peptidivorans TaxID=426128 RepID=A0A1I0CXU3_9FIRM|nr:hypothetical protein [Natronincola peptidivorans]SET24128.1 threonine kinase [Natronincola peptidivorans]
MIQGICPASCGELLQGYMLGGEKLISYSINLFSTVTIIEKTQVDKNSISQNHEKAYRMLESLFRHYGYHKEDYKDIVLKIDSPIPIGKGMASSTADLAATAVAGAKYLKKTITQEEIAKLCIAIEPTDSTIFSHLTLFDHLKGTFKKQYHSLPACKVLLLEGKEIIDTISFRKTDRRSLLKKAEASLGEALSLFEKGIKARDLKEIGKAATISAFANQSILHKEDLEEIHELSQRLGAYGINVAHSGSVMGVLYNDGDFDREGFYHGLLEKKLMKNYLSISSYDIISGGARLAN